jgi:hypothetical protein
MDTSGNIPTENFLTIDEILERVTAKIVKIIPRNLIPVLISYVLWSLSLSKSIFTQSSKITSAIIGSFQVDTIYFLKNANNIAIRENAIYSQIELASEWKWKYIPSRKAFFEKGFEGNLPAKSPWFSAELFCKELMVSDITEWLEGLRIHSEKKDTLPPADILVQAWSIDHQRDIGSLDQYELHVLNDLMESEKIPLRPLP